jgi:hypothetical protein
MVESTESCDINRGKYAQRSKVHKIRKTNFVDLHYSRCNLKIREAIRRTFAKKTVARSFQSLHNREILRAKRRGGGG